MGIERAWKENEILGSIEFFRSYFKKIGENEKQKLIGKISQEVNDNDAFGPKLLRSYTTSIQLSMEGRMAFCKSRTEMVRFAALWTKALW